MGRGRGRGRAIRSVSRPALALIQAPNEYPTLDVLQKSVSAPVSFVRQQIGDDGCPTGTFVIIFSDGEKEVFKPGERFGFEVVGSRHCLGHHDQNGGEHLCPTASVSDTKARCDECASLHFAPAATAAPHERPRRPSAEPHVVYLMTIDGTFVKVGTSRRDRIKKRLGEQGARAAVIFAETENEGDALRIEKSVRHLGRNDRQLADELGQGASSSLSVSPPETSSVREGAQAPLNPRDVRDRFPVTQELQALCNNEIDGSELLPGLKTLTKAIDHRLNGFSRKKKPPVTEDSPPSDVPHELVFAQPYIDAIPELMTKFAPDQRLVGKLLSCVGTFTLYEKPSGEIAAFTNRSLAGRALHLLAPDEGETQQEQITISFDSPPAPGSAETTLPAEFFAATPRTQRPVPVVQTELVDRSVPDKASQLSLQGLSALPKARRRHSKQQLDLDI